jgi:hypothetical protein
MRVNTVIHQSEQDFNFSLLRILRIYLFVNPYTPVEGTNISEGSTAFSFVARPLKIGVLHLLVRLHEVKLQKSINFSTNYTSYYTGNTTRYSLLHLSVPHVSTSTFCHLRINSHDYRQLTLHGKFQITYYIKIVFLNSTTAFGCRGSSVGMATTLWDRWKGLKTRWD